MSDRASSATELQGSRHALLAIGAVALIAMALLPLLVGFRADLLSFRALLTLALVPLLFLPYVYWRKLEALRAPLEATALGLALTLPAIIFSYSAMRIGMPLADGALIGMDVSLGFDWIGFVRLVDDIPWLSRLLGLAYDSFSLQLLFLPTLLCLAGLPARAYQFVLGYLVLTALASAIGIFFPSVGAYQAHGLDPATLQYVDGKFGHFFLSSFHAVRNETDFLLSFGNVAGILTFPSVHAGVAALCAWAAWPSPALRYPILVLNIGMAIGAIPFGAHYLIDILAGILVAAAAIYLVRKSRDWPWAQADLALARLLDLRRRGSAAAQESG